MARNSKTNKREQEKLDQRRARRMKIIVGIFIAMIPVVILAAILFPSAS